MTIDNTVNLLDLSRNTLLFRGLDMDVNRVSGMDFCKKNRLGKNMLTLIETTNEPSTIHAFKTEPEIYHGFMLTDGSCPVGHIYHVKHHEGSSYILQPIYVTVNHKYRCQSFSKVLRLLLLYDTLEKQDDKNDCTSITVVPFSAAREMLYPFFKKLDPNLVSADKLAPKWFYRLNPETVRKNLYKEFENLNISIVD